MEYERIHKLQTGIISPSKLRMKLVEVHNQIKKASGSNKSSPRTSPSRLDDDSQFINNSLLQDSTFHVHNDDADDQGCSLEDSVGSSKLSDEVDKPKEPIASDKVHHIGRGDSGNVGSMYLYKSMEEDNLDCDSNASSSSFEFQKAERAAAHRAFPRPMSSKWNDAEKWIMNRKAVPGSHAVKRQIQASKLPGGNLGRVVPEASSNDKFLNKFAETKRVDFCLPEHAKGLGLEKFSFVAPEKDSDSVVPNPTAQIRNMKEFNHNSGEDASGIGIRAVCMRDMGTEMTPIASQDPSRTSTPLEATTPLRSPYPSLPSTPRRGDPTSTPADYIGDVHKELSEKELKLKTRREIVALGVQLGKVNITAWASKEDRKKHNTPVKTIESKEMEKLEYEKRAAAWEEVENTKRSARLEHEEIQIQAWESHEKAKLEAEVRRIEEKIEQMRAQAQAKMVKKISKTKQRAEAQRIKAEARKNRLAEKAAAQAEYIRETGRLPSSSSFSCCGF